MDEFSENFQRGGGAEIYVADFGPLYRAFFGRLPKKLQDDFPKMRGEG